MKIGIFVSFSETGGSLNQALGFTRSLKSLKLNDNDEICIISDKKIEPNEYIDTNIKFYSFEKTWVDKIKFLLYGYKKKNKYYFFGRLNPFQVFLKKNNIDLLIFSSPSPYSIYCDNFYFVINIWNTEIKKYNNFTELKTGGYLYQKKIIDNAVENAFRIVVFTEKNKLDLINEFGCKSDDIKILNLTPILPKKYEKIKNIDFVKVFNRFNFDKNKKWFFYPAQFWSHKNHIYLIETMNKICKKKLDNYGFIFCGNDKGNKKYIKKKIKDLKLEKNIKILGHIDDEELISIYKYCDAVIIPTYLGRSSLPLLESIYFNKKIYYSKGILDNKLVSYVEEFDLNDPDDLVNKIINYKDNDIEHNYKDLITDKYFRDTYESIIEEFRFLQNKWSEN
jgi:glycosyltransferase involved in cell wall biosynthesis